MNRICEEVQYLDVFAPQAVATATKKTSTFVDTAGADSVEFLIYTGALTSGKKLTVGVQTSANAGGSSPEDAEKMVFTASGSTPGLAVVSYSCLLYTSRLHLLYCSHNKYISCAQ